MYSVFAGNFTKLVTERMEKKGLKCQVFHILVGREVTALHFMNQKRGI